MLMLKKDAGSARRIVLAEYMIVHDVKKLKEGLQEIWKGFGKC